ncbi:MAG: hypothetical protein O7C98_08470 [Planctomycetota bacterium]|nr:hypothetical protein [Planctomycetota bacterium]
MRAHLLIGLLVLALAGTAPAALIDYTVQNGGFDGFGASGVHTGGDAAIIVGLTRSHDNTAIVAPGTSFFASGGALVGFPLNGVIHGDLNEATDTLTILPSLLTAAQGTLMLTGGTIGYDSMAGREFGHIDYTLTVGMDSSTMGKFYFYPVAFAGPANTTDFTVSGGYILTLWGNDWENHEVMGDGLGVDLRAHGALIAEPGSLCLLGIGGLLVLAVRRQRRRTTA